ncbi:Dps family protein [Mangrovibacterium marinum]|uniref:Starvation-inducible DNA-binding protein n=1 Tax=Mangrovibacterium marinum TaxID=1639118 RepID=A0A2T5C1G3_9BACT|nr:DNA starvation/stationary phase protection protein [Mangrovibacterium marinum]PTN08509.1 starvation-inducible DNA-binding protein [Mangrovibacterium marinum]|eukprot:Anaeramoba_ignava/a353216_12.p2 GENE.a353216_12~~a353216_12.p2  ORF type:complete len:155 (+),score=9.96 a353216_12:33-497(+)
MKTQVKTQAVNETMVNELNQFLADMQIHYQNLRAFHWNVKGNMFFVLHAKFEEYYNEAAEVVDEVAERILMIGGKPLHSFSDYLSAASISEVKDVTDGITAVKHVIEQQQALLQQMNKIQANAADRGDEATNALFSDLISNTEKRLWMLRTFLA